MGLSGWGVWCVFKVQVAGGSRQQKEFEAATQPTNNGDKTLLSSAIARLCMCEEAIANLCMCEGRLRTHRCRCRGQDRRVFAGVVSEGGWGGGWAGDGALHGYFIGATWHDHTKHADHTKRILQLIGAK